ncbi:unnamed protein product [Tuber aestivum]|uniref:N-acetyltransferase domain-containing protein n=1 Tax=Tuber aestivum TaxID=59557 RepID=A0A292Q8E1_9PEZI|nr:unnamed protein product [Tuber aestivum]
MEFIREYRKGDFGDIVEICKLTAHPSIHPSADILPYIYAVPYVKLEPAHAFVLDAGSSDNASGRRVVGYIIGTPDTNTFVERYKREYLPTLPPAIANTTADTSAAVQADDGDGDELRRMFGRILLNPEDMLHSATSHFIPRYPAHLHIDILPEFQGKGFGGKLMGRFLHRVRARDGDGACGVHLGMRQDNVAAGRFYERWVDGGGSGGGGREDERTKKQEQDGEGREGEGDVGCGASKGDDASDHRGVW